MIYKYYTMKPMFTTMTKYKEKNLRLWEALIKTTSLWKQAGFLFYSLE